MIFDRPDVLTVGHSSLSREDFIGLVRDAGVTAIADVRSSPYSARLAHFNREALGDALRGQNIAYAFMGAEIGGRPSDNALMRDGVADYERMALLPAFRSGLDRVMEGARRHRIALMCSEHDPLECHRCLLVGRALAARGVAVAHLLRDGSRMCHGEAEARLLSITGRGAADLFASREDRIAMAYRERARKVAFAAEDAAEPARAPVAAAE